MGSFEGAVSVQGARAIIPLSGVTCQIIHASGGSEAEMIEQQKVKLREERESVTWRFRFMLKYALMIK